MECVPINKNVSLIFCRISVEDVRLKLSSSNKSKQSAPKPVEQSSEDSDEYELGKDIKDEKKRKA